MAGSKIQFAVYRNVFGMQEVQYVGVLMQVLQFTEISHVPHVKTEDIISGDNPLGQLVTQEFKCIL
jgi:hypothetical protein